MYFVEFQIPGIIEKFGRNCGSEGEARELIEFVKRTADAHGKTYQISVKKDGENINLK